MIVLIFSNAVTYVILLSKNNEWISEVKDKRNNTFELIEALSEHLYYDGDSISFNQMIRHYSRSGKLIESVNMSELLEGDKVVLLLSYNCCSGCAKNEIIKLKALAKKIGHEHMLMVADFNMHKLRSWTTCFENVGFYETDLEHLGLKGSPTKETPVVMLTQNGRIKSSFVIGLQTSDFVNRFHEYLEEYFKGKK
ncbi:MAG: hypothetical protein Q4D33_14285 [Prevotellaceae bacterium]|nr:hypothetical protein [Prevotellaceae bacterium]